MQWLDVNFEFEVLRSARAEIVIKSRLPDEERAERVEPIGAIMRVARK
ncbi:MAG: hypothetical protein ABIL01_21245 [Pseudomonadota bacterium]